MVYNIYIRRVVIKIKVIIAEKPSLARNIVESIGGMKKQTGFYIGGEYGMTGVDVTEITAGSSYAFKVEK